MPSFEQETSPEQPNKKSLEVKAKEDVQQFIMDQMAADGALAKVQDEKDAERTAEILEIIQRMPPVDMTVFMDEKQKNEYMLQDQHAMRAYVRNNDRPRWKKILGIGKVSAEDIIKEGHGLEPSANALLHVERARKYSPKALQAFQEGRFADGRKQEIKTFRKLKGDAYGEAVSSFQHVRKMKIYEAVASGNIKAMKEIVENYHHSAIGIDVLARMPKDITHTPGLQSQLILSIKGYIENADDPERALSFSNKLIKFDLLDRKQVIDAFQSGEVQTHLYQSISGLVVNARDPEKAKKVAEQYVLLGIMERDKAEKALQTKS